MTYDEIITALILKTVEDIRPGTHERVLIDRYRAEQAKLIALRLLGDTDTTRVIFQEDDGTASSQSIPCRKISVGGMQYELIPFVVVGDRASGSEGWLGSRGFASRMRDNFSAGVESGIARILLLFDDAPVETERTASSVDLATAMDSIESLIEWLQDDARSTGFTARIHELTRHVLQWWAQRLRSEPVWLSDSHAQLLERAANFFEACRPLDDVRKVGQKLPLLGLTFKDPDIAVHVGRATQLQKRLDANADTAAFLDAIRRRRTVDSVIEADHHFDLGTPGEIFYDAITIALRSFEGPITTAEVTYSDIDAHRRTNVREPVRLDPDSVQFVARTELGSDSEAELRWQFVSPPEDPPDELDIAVACPATTAELRADAVGNTRGFLFLDGALLSPLAPSSPVSISIPVREAFSVHEIVTKERTHPRSRPTQVLRVALTNGDAIVVPEEAGLDRDKQAYLVDARLDRILVQIGNVEHVIEDQIPPDDGKPIEVQIDGVKFRWAAEDRTAAGPTPDPRGNSVQLLELHGVETSGDPFDVAPVITASFEIVATNGRAARLDVPADYLSKEAELLRNPELFVGLTSDNGAAVENISRVERNALNGWLSSRKAFFASVINFCRERLGQVGEDRPSLYLTNFTTPAVEAAAREYVLAYCSLLDAVREHVRGGSNSALVEPLVLCDRASEGPNFFRLSPTHPVGVAFAATVQHGLFSQSWLDQGDRAALVSLFGAPLLSGVLPWIQWRGKFLESSRSCPLLWREYGSSTSREVDTDADLAQVITAKVKRILISLSPHLNQTQQTLYINIDIGASTGQYVLDALRALERDEKIQSRLDVGLAGSGAKGSALLEVFRGRLDQDTNDGPRSVLQGKVRVAVLSNVADRDAHLVFRMTGPNSETLPFTNVSEDHQLVRDCGFAGGLSQEPVRFAVNSADQVQYEQYVSTRPPEGEAAPTEGLWDGPWRRLWLRTTQITRRLAVGLISGVSADLVPSRKLVQVARSDEATEYERSFITVHCDPAQGPEFFVGPRSRRSGVYLVECSDRGSPELPGRDIVSVTSYISPFRAALRRALEGLPPALRDSVNDDVAKALLRDINVLRGTEVFDFMREAARDEPNRTLYMEGLDNVLAMRLLLRARAITVPNALPVVVGLKDLTARCDTLADLRGGTKSDDIIVFYIPPVCDRFVSIFYRLVEVKFGPRQNQWRKAQQQLSETSRKLRTHFPSGIWRADRSPVGLILERDLAWVIHEGIERYRAFGLIEDDPTFERAWGIKQLFSRLHSGNFQMVPGGFASPHSIWDSLNGSAIMLDPDIPGGTVLTEVENATEHVTISRDMIADLLINPATLHTSRGSGPSPIPQGDEPIPTAPVGGGTRELNGGVAPAPPRVEQPVTASVAAAAAEPSMTAPTPATPETAIPGVSEVATAEIERSRARIEDTFAGFVGNMGAVEWIKRDLRYAAIENHRWLDPIGLFGPKSTGKTELARRISEALRVPTVAVSDTTLTSADDLGSKIQEIADQAGEPMRIEMRDFGARVEVAPPMVVFIDEVHLLKARVQDSLLKAMEPNDRTLLTSHGEIDTRQITFIIATTDPGRLRDAFKSRVSKLDLKEYSLDEIVEILKSHRERSTTALPEEVRQFNDEALRVVATVGRLVPRQALLCLKDAARAVRLRDVAPTAADLRRYFWETRSSDEIGLTERDWRYLQLLFPDSRKGRDALAAAMGEDPTTVELEIEPFLLRLGLIERERGGRCLTAEGREAVGRHNRGLRGTRDGQ
jgi:Holliday junction DNA helicase RuvB